MFQTLGNIFKVEDLRRRILFTLLMLVVFRIGSFIPVPNTNADALIALGQHGAFNLLNTFSGGALSQFSIFAMGIMPYITASIIVQLLTMDVIPKFAQWAKEGEVGRRKLAQVTRYLTIVLALIQSVGLAIGFDRVASSALPGVEFITDKSFASYALISLTLTAGTAFLMWLGEQITDKGIGNGISILIFAGIVAGIPSAIAQIYESQFANAGDQIFLVIVKLVIIVAVLVLIVAGVIYIQQGVRKIPVQYAKRVVGRKMFGGQSTHIPMRVNAAGVIPVIFALSLLTFPTTIAQFWPNNPVAVWIYTNLFLHVCADQSGAVGGPDEKERRLHPRDSTRQKHICLSDQGHESPHLGRGAVPCCGFDFACLLLIRGETAEYGTDWWDIAADRDRCRAGNDENDRESADQTALQRIHQIAQVPRG
jgi:preprotein translocase subunit SecY